MAGWDGSKMVAPLSIGDVASAVNESSGDLGTLCRSSHMNIWAKYKPENLSSDHYITEQQRKNNNYGLSATQYTSPDSAAGTYWTWTKPASKYRIFDFVKVTDAGVPSTEVGYTLNDVAPCRGFYSGSSTSQLSTYQYWVGQNTQLAVNFWVIDSGNDWGIPLSDMGGIGSWYLCLAVKKDTTHIYFVTSSSTLANGATSITVPKDTNNYFGSSETTYNAYVCLANKSKTSWFPVSSDSSLRFMPLPLTAPSIANILFHLNSGSYSAWLTSAYRKTSGAIADRRKVWYYLWGRNTTNLAVTITTLNLELVTGDTMEQAAVTTTVLTTKSYVGTSAITIPVTGTGGTALDGDGDTVYIGYTQLPTLTSGTIFVRTKGYNSNNTLLFSTIAEVTDYSPTPPPTPIDPDRQ